MQNQKLRTDSFKEKVKLGLFSLFSMMISTTLKSGIIYGIILLLESVQIWFLCQLVQYKHIPHAKDNLFTAFAQNNPYFALYLDEAVRANFSIFFLIVSICIVSTFILFWFLSWRAYKSIKSKSVSQGINFLINMLGIILLLSSRLLIVPISNIGAVQGTQKQQISGYDETRFLMLATGPIIWGQSLFMDLITLVFFNSNDPMSNLPWAINQKEIDISRYANKIIFTLLLSQSYNGGILLTLGINFVFSLYDIFALLSQPKMLSSKIQIIQIITTSIIASTLFSGFFNCIVGDHVLNFYFEILWTLILVPLILQIKQSIIKYQINQIVLGKSLDPTYVLITVLSIINFEKEKEKNSKPLTDYILKHKQICQKEECHCQNIHWGYTSKHEEYNNLLIRKLSKTTLPIHRKCSSTVYSPGSIDFESFRSLSKPGGSLVIEDNINNNTEMKNIFEMTKLYILDSLAHKGSNAKLYILQAYIERIYLNKKIESLYTVWEAETAHPSLFQQFELFCFIKKAEGDIERDIFKVDNQNIDIMKIVNFHINYLQFYSSITETTGKYLELWRELMKENPIYKKVIKDGESLSKTDDSLFQQFKYLLGLDHNSLKLFVLYGLFLRQVVLDKNRAKETYFGALDIQKRLIQQDITDRNQQSRSMENKFGANSNAAIFVISGVKESLGIIQKCSTEIERISGFKSTELIGESINKLVPTKLIRKCHDKLMMNFIKNSEQDGEGKGLLHNTFMLNNRGFILPTFIWNYILPTMTHGIQIICFCLPNKNIDYLRLEEDNIKPRNVPILILDSKFNILGFSKALSRLWNISPTQVDPFKYTKIVNLHELYPHIFSDINIPQFLSCDGLDEELDLQPLTQTLFNEIYEYTGSGSQLELNDPEQINIHRSRLTEDSLDQFDLNLPHEMNQMLNIKLKVIRITSQNMKTLKFFVCTLASPMHNILCTSESSTYDSVLQFTHRNVIEEEKAQILNIDDVASVCSSVISNQDDEGKIIREFKFGISKRVGASAIKYLYRILYVIFLILLAINIICIILEIESAKRMQEVVEITQLVYLRLGDLYQIPLMTYLLGSFARAIQPSTSLIIFDRPAYYSDRADKNREELRKHQHQIAKKTINDYIKDYDEDYGRIPMRHRKFMETSYTVEEMPFDKAVEYMLAQIDNYMSATASYKFMSSDFMRMQETTNFIIDNGLFAFRIASEKMAEDMAECYLDSKDKMINSVVPLVYIALCFSSLGLFCFIPIILRSNTHIHSLLIIISKILPQHIIPIYKSTLIFEEKSKNSFMEIQQSFKEENFEEIDEDIEYKKEKLNKNSRQGENRRNSVGEETDSLQMEELEEWELKEKSMLKTRHNQINKLLFATKWKFTFKIINFLIVIACYYLIKLYIIQIIDVKVEKSIKYMKLINERKNCVELSNFIFNKVIFDSVAYKQDMEWGEGDLLLHYLNKLSKIEIELAKEHNNIKKYYENQYSFFEIMDSMNCCSLHPNISLRENCTRDHGELMKSGMIMALNSYETQIMKIYSEFNAYLPDVPAFFRYSVFNRPELLNMTDVLHYYIIDILKASTKEMNEAVKDYFEEFKAIYFYLFYGIFAVLVLIFFLTLIFVINEFNTITIRIKRMLSLIPSNLMANHIRKMKKIVKKLS